MEENKEMYLVYSNDYWLDVVGRSKGDDSGAVNDAPARALSADDKKEMFIRSFFANNSFRHSALLTGSGSSVVCGGKIREGLWESCKESIQRISKIIKGHESYVASKDIESFLSHAVQYATITKKASLGKAIAKLKREIRQACDLKLEGCAHEEVIKKMTARKATLPRAEIFTTNYDTLFEQAATRSGIIVIDGFSFSQPRTFSGRYFDYDIVDREMTRTKSEENYVPNVIHLHKLHASLDWVLEGNSVVQRNLRAEEEPLIIYPSRDKYAESYDQPYFEMMARFQAFLRKKDCLLMVAGYGFADKHINSAIIDAVRQNPSFHLFVVDYGIEVEVDTNRKAHVINMNLYRSLFTDIGNNMTIVRETFDGFARSMPLNKAYRIDEHSDMPNIRV